MIEKRCGTDSEKARRNAQLSAPLCSFPHLKMVESCYYDAVKWVRTPNSLLPSPPLATPGLRKWWAF